MKFLSVCSGIEAASVAWGPLGWEAVAFAEIEPFPCAVLQHHYPTVPNWGDMTKYQEWPSVAIDLLCGGTPCQSFSVAGLGKGLADPRGQLMLTFGAIAAKYRPRWLVWENVAGVLQKNRGRDFASFLGLITGTVVEVPPGGWQNSGIVGGISSAYGAAYRVLDAQYVRVESHPRAIPQRRRRVFVVGYLGDWRRAAAVLFERESLSGHPAPRRQAGKGIAPTLSARTQGGGGLGTDFDCDGGLVHCHDVAPTLDAHFGDKQGLEDQHIRGGGACSLPDISQCLTTGTGQRYDPETETLIPTIGGGFDVAHSLRGEGFDASEDGTGRGTPLVPVGVDGWNGAVTDGVAATMGTRGSSATASGPAVMVPIAFNATDYQSGAFEQAEQASPLTTSADRSRAAPIIAFSAKDHGADASEDVSPTVRAGGHANSHANAGVMPAIAYAIQAGALRENPDSGPDGIGVQADHAYTIEARAEVQAVALRGREDGATAELGGNVGHALRASSGGGDKAHALVGMQVRRLTPRETERLMGFPDDYTLIPYGRPSKAKLDADFLKYQLRGNPMHLTREDIDHLAKDGPRYKSHGNSWAINCARWIGERIAAVESVTEIREAA